MSTSMNVKAKVAAMNALAVSPSLPGLAYAGYASPTVSTPRRSPSGSLRSGRSLLALNRLILIVSGSSKRECVARFRSHVFIEHVYGKGDGRSAITACSMLSNRSVSIFARSSSPQIQTRSPSPILPNGTRPERIQVYVRVRGGEEDAATDQSQWIVQPKQISDGKRFYAAEAAFGGEVSTAVVYDKAVKVVVQSVKEGFNGTVLAYGQTGAGKTYTMRGQNGQEGVIELALRDLFRDISADDERTYRVAVAYLELHNEVLYDLLASEKKKIEMRERGE
eukprot:600235-Prorocentrum_minimum.AAC.3